MLFSGAKGKMIHEKNLKQKILWHRPFKGAVKPYRTQAKNLLVIGPNLRIFHTFYSPRKYIQTRDRRFYTIIYIPCFLPAVFEVHLTEISMAQDVFAKHGDLLKELKVNPNNGLGDLYDKIKGHPLQYTIEKDIQVCRG